MDFDKFGSIGMATGMYVYSEDAASQNCLTVDNSSGKGTAYFGTTPYPSTQAAIPANAVHRIAHRVSNGVLDLWLDGVLQGTGSVDAPAIPTTVHIGSFTGGLYQLYGHLRNLRIYDRALSSAEIAAA